MNLVTIKNASEVPTCLQRAAKCALAVDASVAVNTAGDALMVKFDGGADRFHFDPDDATLHALEMLDAARTHGFVRYTVSVPPPGCTEGNIIFRGMPAMYVIRIVHSHDDVRVQIGASRWYTVKHHNTAHAMRTALVDAFCDYYDEAIAPYSAA